MKPMTNNTVPSVSIGSWYSCGCLFDTCHPPKHCKVSTPHHGNGTPPKTAQKI